MPSEEDVTVSPDSSSGGLFAVFNYLFSSPLNVALTLICAYFIYKLFKGKSRDDEPEPDVFKIPPPLPKHDVTLEELRNYNGLGEDGRICVAINGKVYDCTKGRRFYGPEGPYANLAGRDATRALASFDVNAVKDDWDDYEGLSSSDLASVQEWDEQFSERYDYVGLLVKEAPKDESQGGDEASVNEIEEK